MIRLSRRRMASVLGLLALGLLGIALFALATGPSEIGMGEVIGLL